VRLRPGADIGLVRGNAAKRQAGNFG